MPLDEILAVVSDPRDLWNAMFSFQTAVDTCVSGFLLPDMGDDSDVKDKADEFAQLVQSVIDNPKVGVLPHAQVVTQVKAAYAACTAWRTAIDSWAPPTNITEKRDEFEKLAKEFDRCRTDLDTYTSAVAGLVAKEEAKSVLSVQKSKKAKSGQVWRMFGKLERDGVPKFLAKVTLSPLASLYYITLLYYCILLYDYSIV